MDEQDVGISDIVFDSDSKERSPWSIFGVSVSRSLVLFSIQVFALLVLFVFCLYQINYGNNNPYIYLCIISACVGYLLPAPTVSFLRSVDKDQANNNFQA